MPIDQIKIGTIAKGYTVFRSPEISQFDAEIIGILKNQIGPGRNVIMAKLTHPELEGYGGVVAGMSGSPVYIDGKLIGAVAYGWGRFSKDHIAGISPIEEMLDVLNTPISRGINPTNNSDSDLFNFLINLKFTNDNNEDISQSILDFGQKTRIENNSLLKPLAIPVYSSGNDLKSINLLDRHLERLGMNLIPTGLAKVSEFNDDDLKPGAPVGIQFVGGDLNYSGLGTLTYREGNNILAFGHPALQAGNVSFPLVSGEIMTLVKSESRAYKMGFGTEVIGTVVQDRTTAIAGKIGESPPLIPMGVRLKDMNNKVREFNFDIITEKKLTPVLSMVCLSEAISCENWIFGDMTVIPSVKIKIDGYETMKFEDIFSGSNSIKSTSDNFLLLMSILSMNPYEPATFESIDVDINITDEVFRGEIVSLTVDKKEYEPGDEISGHFKIKPIFKDAEKFHFNIEIPENYKGKSIELRVCDAITSERIEYKTNPGKYIPHDFDSLYNILKEYENNSTIIVDLVVKGLGRTIKGKEFNSIPNSVMKVINSRKNSGKSKPSFKRILNREKIKSKYQVSGLKSVRIKINKKLS